MKKKFNVMQSSDSNEQMSVWEVTNNVATSEINEAVYTVFITVGNALLDRSTCYLGGDHTAAEIAGKLGGKFVPCVMFNTCEQLKMADIVKIVIGDKFSVQFPTDTLFEHMVEWEGQMGLSPKKQHLFYCECKQESFSREPIKPYTRCHQAKQTNPYSAAREATRQNKKFEVLGQLYNSLTSEGMRKALSVLVAIGFYEKTDFTKRDMAMKAMLRKLWDDYGKKDGYLKRDIELGKQLDGLHRIGADKDQVIALNAEINKNRELLALSRDAFPFTAKDFKFGPEVYKQVDDKYVMELRRHFEKMLAEDKKPTGIEVGDYVQFVGRENKTKAYQGKYLVEGIRQEIDYYGRRIEWKIAIRFKKYETWLCYPSQLEKWVDTKKAKTAAKAAKAEPAAPVLPEWAKDGAKCYVIHNGERLEGFISDIHLGWKGRHYSCTFHEKNSLRQIPCRVDDVGYLGDALQAEPTLEDKLREALKKQLMAA